MLLEILSNTYLITAVIAGLVLWIFLNQKSKKGLPGPIGLPVFGYLPFLGRKVNVTFTDLAEKYGDVYQVTIGSQKIVVICKQRAIREALLRKGNDFSGRPDFYTYQRGFGVFGIPGYTTSFKLYKRLTLTSMQLFATARKSELQTSAYRAVDMLLSEIESLKGEPFDPKPVLYRVVWTIMGYICYGKYFNINDPEVDRVFENVDSFGKTMMFGVLLDYFPWAKWLMRKQLKQYDTLMDTIDKYSHKLAEENVKSFDPSKDNEARNIADVFRLAGENMTPEERINLKITDAALLDVVTSLFGAGFGTIAAMTQWSLMLMAKYPRVQSDVRDEIERVVGTDHYAEFDDMKNLPYSMAVITEIYRFASMAALSITHATTVDTNIDGYQIEKGTPVVFNLFSAHRDESVFPDPERFDPQRYLTASGTLDPDMCDLVIPFGLGARRCGGEALAKLEVFLFFVTLIQKCDILPHQDYPLDPTNYFFGLGLSLAPFKVVLKPR